MDGFKIRVMFAVQKTVTESVCPAINEPFTKA